MKREVRTVRSRLVILAVLMCTSILFVVGFGGIALAAEPVTIRLQTWHLGEEPWVFAWEEFKEAFEKENPNIKIQAMSMKTQKVVSAFLWWGIGPRFTPTGLMHSSSLPDAL